MSKIAPMYDYVIVDKISKDLSSGTIVLTKDSDTVSFGVVVAVGPGINGREVSVKPGEKIMYLKNAGLKVNYDGRECWSFKEEMIIGVIED